MDQEIVLDLMQNVFVLVLVLAAPVLVVSIIVGLAVSIFQTVTQIQESTLTFVPKIVAAVITLIILMPWMMNLFVSQVHEIFDKIPSIIH